MSTIMSDVVALLMEELVAANTIIDALCGHLTQLGDGGSDYDRVFAAIDRRRLNWSSILGMQTYHSIDDVTVELRRVMEKKSVKQNKDFIDQVNQCLDEQDQVDNQVVDHGEDSPHNEITDSGSPRQCPISGDKDICTNHDDCMTRASRIKLSKGFSAKGQVKGRMVNFVNGLKLYEDIFTHSELSKLTDFVTQLHSAALNGRLSGDTYILFNKHMKGNRREMIQFGVPLFGHITKDDTRKIELIPDLLKSVIDHLVLWGLIPEYKKPNGCIINFFQEEEHSQPFEKPPHLDHPMATLFLSESRMALGHTLVTGDDGKYRGPLLLSLKEGSLLVMRGNSADMARHVMCAHPNKRVSITFYRVRPDSKPCWSSSVNGAIIHRQAAGLNPYALMKLMPNWGAHVPVSIFPPLLTLPNAAGTGVFLPTTPKSRIFRRNLPPRARPSSL